ncbi:MAG: CGNR zinc finger domain-containing protein [Nocardioides sp.]
MIFDSYRDAGLFVAADLVNHHRHDKLTPETLRGVLATDPDSVRRLRDEHLPGFARLARQLEPVFAHLSDGDEDATADRLNHILSRHPAHPHLAKEDGRWRLHHHPDSIELFPMWAAICAEALARLLAHGHASRVGTCAAPPCADVYIDTSRNGTRRFCSTTCQNRTKTAAFRARRTSSN